MFRRLFRVAARAAALALVAAGGSGLARASEVALAAYDRVEIPPAKTSIYVGSVTMTMPVLVRKNGTYETSYAAKVFPYFFENEKGQLFVTLNDDQLRELAKGNAIEFTGRGVRDDGVERRVEGKATPADATSGKLKVRVFVSKKIELIFNTTYRFVPP